MEFGVVYWVNGSATYRECDSEAAARDAWEHAPQPSGCIASLIIAGKEAEERSSPPDE